MNEITRGKQSRRRAKRDRPSVVAAHPLKDERSALFSEPADRREREWDNSATSVPRRDLQHARAPAKNPKGPSAVGAAAFDPDLDAPMGALDDQGNSGSPAANWSARQYQNV